MGILFNLKKGITLEQLNGMFSKAMQKTINAEKLPAEVVECRGKTASEIAEMVSKKDVATFSKPAKVAMETPYVEMDLRGSVTDSGLRGETKSIVYDDGTTKKLERFYDEKDNTLARTHYRTEFADGNRRYLGETFGTNPTKSMVAYGKDGTRTYQQFVDKDGRKISFVNYFDKKVEGINHAHKGTFHIDDQKIKFECIKNDNGNYTNRYKAQINNGGVVENKVFNGYEELAEYINVPRDLFWGY